MRKRIRIRFGKKVVTLAHWMIGLGESLIPRSRSWTRIGKKVELWGYNLWATGDDIVRGRKLTWQENDFYVSFPEGHPLYMPEEENQMHFPFRNSYHVGFVDDDGAQVLPKEDSNAD